MIRFTCPSCKTLLQTGDDQGGVLVGCPKCRSQMKVPSPSVPPPAAIVPMVGNTAGATQTGRPATLPSSPQPVEARLRELLTKHGAGLCSEARRCESMIRDICGDKTKEAHLLIQGLKQQLPTDLLAIPKGASPVPALERLRKRLEDNLGLAEAPARWTVQCWALALHVVTEADLKADELPEVLPADLPQNPRTESYLKVYDDAVEKMFRDIGVVATGKDGSDRRPPLPDQSVDQGYQDYVAQSGVVAFFSDQFRLQGPIPQHPEALIAECQRLVGMPLFSRTWLNPVGEGARSRFRACLAKLERWAFFYPEYRGDFLNLWNQTASLFKVGMISLDHFQLVEVRRKYEGSA